MSAEGFRVTETIEGAHRKIAEYPLLPGDLLVRDADGTWAKEAPGLAVCGFVLTADQEATLTPVKFDRLGLAYQVLDGGGLREVQS